MSWRERLRRVLGGAPRSGSELPELRDAPGPSPWYLRGRPSGVPGFSWEAAGGKGQLAGATVLTGPAGGVLVLDFHNHVLPLDSATLLVWHQAHVASGPTKPVMLRVFCVPDLAPLRGDLETLCASMRAERRPFVSSTPPALEFAIPTTAAAARQPLTFPESLRPIPELLILCASSDVDSDPGADRGQLGLMIASPRDGAFEIVPQDWFNRGGFDYGYEWVTRVARDPRTGRIHGDGIRIEPFVLDRTLRGRL